MALETIQTDFGEEAVLVAGVGNKIISSPVSAAVDTQPGNIENQEPPVEEPAAAPEASAEIAEASTLEMVVAVEEDDAAEEKKDEEGDATEENKVELPDDPNERDFDKNPTTLFALIQKKEWSAVIERAQTHYEEAKVWVSRKEKDGCLRWRLLPLHAAIVFKAPEHIFETLLAAYPKGAHLKDDQGMLPLHLAFRTGSPEGVVNLLLVSYPESIDVPDRKGRIPLVLAQASNSPNKEAFMRALERGPRYYAVAAASTERASVTAEQRGIYDARMMQAKQFHQHEVESLTTEAGNKQRDLQAKVEEMERELAKTQDTSQVLVDHVNSLEAQLNSRSDTERFLATKIATLDSSLKSTTQTREETESKLKTENYSLAIERDAYKLKYEHLENKNQSAQEKLTQALDLCEAREKEWANTHSDLSQQVQQTEIDWANAQANCAILDAQLKKKMETEHSLATQVSSLAGKLAESAGYNRDNSNKYCKRIKDLEMERVGLRNSVQDLTKRLTLVARVLENMTVQQNRIVDEAQTHEAAIGQALAAHTQIVADAMEQEATLEHARCEREEMKKLLAKQEESVAESEEKRAKIMNAIAAQGKHMENTKSARDEILQSVHAIGVSAKDVLENILSLLPKDDEQSSDLADSVVKVTAPIVTAVPVPVQQAPLPIADESRPTPTSPTVDVVPVLAEKGTRDEESTEQTAQSSKEGTAVELEDASVLETIEIDESDRIMAARSDI